MSIQPFIRQVEVLVGPLPEWKGGGEPGAALRFYGDGSPEGLRIKFQIHTHVISTASPTVVSLYNLRQETRNILQESNAQILLRAGWRNTKMSQLFQGSLLAVVNQRQGPDIVTELISLAGWGSMSRAIASATFAGGTRIKDVVISLAREFPSVTVDPELIQIDDVPLGAQGWSFAGTTQDALNRLSRAYGFGWWIDNGVFHALEDDNQFNGKRALISYKDGSLLRAEPMLASPMQERVGVTINSILNPVIEAGGIVELESGLNPKVNGEYKVHNLAHSGDTHGPEWDSRVESWVVVGAGL